ncbi:MAG: mechanosensitive ion channel family protein [Bacteroidota bacterium]|nr:mechanosensitive ion channel family protein [Bacteroidota bacterium]MDQ6888871.1 mechanosensitive ion channel family protein [Bacteroidota bacterium]
MNFWNTVYFGNPLKDWAIAFGIVTVAFSLIKILRLPVLNRFKKWSEKTTNSFDDFIVLAIEKCLIPFLYFVAIYSALQYLTFNEPINRAVRVAMMFIVTFYILRLLSSAVQYSIFTFLGKQDNSETKQKQARGLILIFKALIWIVGIVFLMNNLGYNVTTIITGLGIGGIAVALAAQTILGDLFSYFVIFFDRPFEIGDFLKVDDKAGNVEYIGIKTTRIRAIGGEQLIFSNKDLTDSRVHNFKRMERRRIVFSIGVTYQTSTEHLKKIPEIIKQIIESVDGATFDRSHFSGFGDFSLNFESVYYVAGPEFNEYMDRQQNMYLQIFEAFEKEGIEFAYPTQTLFAGNAFAKGNEEKNNLPS